MRSVCSRPPGSSLILLGKGKVERIVMKAKAQPVYLAHLWNQDRNSATSEAMRVKFKSTVSGP